MTQHLYRVETFIAARIRRYGGEGRRLLSPVLKATAGQLPPLLLGLCSAGTWLLCYPAAGRTGERGFDCHY